MNNEESRSLFSEAVELFECRKYSEALALLDTVDKQHPNSRHINFHRALCLVELGRLDEAILCQRRIEGRIKPQDQEKLANAIDSAKLLIRHGSEKKEEEVKPDVDSENIFIVQSVYPVSTEECSVVGSVKKGVFHVDDIANVVGASGALLPAPIMRIGPADTPLLLAREGQHIMFLLHIAPEQVNPGTSIICETHLDAHAATIMVRPSASIQTDILERPAALAPVERMIKQGVYDKAERLLNAYADQHPTNMATKRMLAQVYLAEDSPVRDPAKALYLIQMVYQAGGAEDPAVNTLLAHAQAENGDTKMGLRFMERLYALTTDDRAKQALIQRIHDFRSKYNLGDLWEFADSYGEVVFKSSDPAEVVRAVVNGAVPLEATCRRNSVGEFTPLETTLAPIFPEVAALFKPKKQQWSPGFLILVFLLLLSILMALFLPSFL